MDKIVDALFPTPEKRRQRVRVGTRSGDSIVHVGGAHTRCALHEEQKSTRTEWHTSRCANSGDYPLPSILAAYVRVPGSGDFPGAMESSAASANQQEKGQPGLSVGVPIPVYVKHNEQGDGEAAKAPIADSDSGGWRPLRSTARLSMGSFYH